jgi:phenylalanyl-tRNA synthetase beta chain
MKVPYSMLLDLVKTSLSAEEAGDLLTMAGFELEGIEEVQGEPVLDIKVVSNRGDGLSVLGLAREVLAEDASATPTELYKRSANRFADLAATSNDGTSVSIDTPNCTRYACRLFTGLTKSASPQWLQDRVTKAGMRPISLVVDLTNYVMLEQGQPLHAFDFDKLKGGRIVVRQAKAGEKIKTLDGVEHQLSPFMMMICDAEHPVAVAGVMGGEETEVSSSTTRMLLESAHFVNTSVRKTRRALAISTEASYRFERSVDPDGVVSAISRFTELFLQCAGGNADAPITDLYPTPPKQSSIRLRLSRSALLLGMTITAEEANRYLTSLGFSVRGSDDSYEVTPPSWRPDVLREEDVIEELGRVHGYDRIPEILPHGSTTLGGTWGYEKWEDTVRECTLRLGFTQTISHTLRDASPLDNPNWERIGPRGMSDPEMMWLRSSTLASLADAVRRNSGKPLRLFELGQVFGTQGKETIERTSLGLLMQGAVDLEWWNAKSGQSSTFFSLKGVLEAIGREILTAIEFQIPGHADSRLHPTRQADVFAPCGKIGVLGQIDPDVAENAGLPGDTILAEIDLTTAFASAQHEVHVRQISRNPAVRRDLAFLIDKTTPYETVQQTVVDGAGPLLEDHWLFDVYEGKGVPEGKHSLAVALQLRKVGANLTDEEANQVRENVVKALQTLGATPR